jgi:FkbM family methyltransferase
MSLARVRVHVVHATAVPLSDCSARKIVYCRGRPRPLISRWLERRAAKFLRRRGYFVGQGRDLSDRYSASYLASYGFQISTLVDVGVLDGSPVFYELFGDRKIVAVDPLPDIARRMKPWQDQGLDIVIVNAGAGAEHTSMELNISGPYSGFLPRLDGKGRDRGRATVRVAPLDELLGEIGAKGPFGIKIDTEGFELEVLKGARAVLSETAFVFAEVNLTERFEGSYRPSELIGFLADHGFELADPIPNAQHARHFDGLFLPQRS